MKLSKTRTGSAELRRIFSVVAIAAGAVLRASPPTPAPEEMFTPPVPYLTPEQSLEHMRLPPGYRLELVLSEPEIREPVAIAFDGNGRMYVAEMRSYMQDIDGSGSREPNGRVSVHWSSRGDDVFDRHEVFIDNLVLPRMLLPLDDGRVLVAETDSNDVYEYRDIDGDHRADERTLVYDADPSHANLEHQTSGLLWAADNWIYTTYNPFRLRWNPDGPMFKEPTAPNGGQWGLAQDNYGKPWFVNAGGEIGPINFQQPIVYGGFTIEGEIEPGFREVFPLVPIPDVQGGPHRFRPDEKTLNHFTATCGPVIVRGDRLPGDLIGDLLFAEPVGRLIRRTEIDVTDGVTVLRNAHPGSEFIRSTDPNFRPVNLANGPDGAIYIVDMYRGIIQEANWVREGSYLRDVVKEYGFQHNFGRGRIWRLVHEDHKPGPHPQLFEETAEQLVERLDHPNGWWRDMAQRLLILRQATEVAPRLVEVARAHDNHLARFHALWTLEGLGELTSTHVRLALADEHPQIRAAALRTSETLFKSGEAASLREDIVRMLDDPDPNVVIQAMLTINLLDWPDAAELIQATVPKHRARGVREIGRQLLEKRGEAAPLLAGEQWELFDQGRAIYQQLCFSCHGADGRGTAVQLATGAGLLAPALAESETVLAHPAASIRVMLHGLAGPLDGVGYPGVMVAMGANDDEWIASVLTYVRNAFGNRAEAVEPAEVARIRKLTEGRSEPWTIEEIRRATPHLLGDRESWTLGASDNAETLPFLIDGDAATRYTSRRPRSNGMWIEIELPREERVRLIEIDSRPSPLDWGAEISVEISDDGQVWHDAEAVDAAVGPRTTVVLSGEPVRYLRLVNHEVVSRFWWSIHELRLFALAAEDDRSGR